MSLDEETRQKLGAFLVEQRNLRQRECETIDEFLNWLGKPFQDKTWQPEKIPWKQAEGSRGPYMRYPGEGEKAEATDNYRNMLADLKEHNSKLMRDGFFYWIFTDGATVGRKKKASKKPQDPHTRLETNLQNVKEASQKLAS